MPPFMKPAEDEKPELLKDSPLQLVIGENDPEENDFPYAGFGDNLQRYGSNETKKPSNTPTRRIPSLKNCAVKRLNFMCYLQTV